MGRKVSYASKIKLRKCDKVCNYLAKRDRISELPDEVVISILSCLTLKEATKTSVLSHRWEKLWTFTTGILDFDGTETLIGMELEELEYQRVNYTDWVNRVLKLHEGHSIDEFRILFDLESSSSPDINNWIEFALLKGVKRLELDLRSWVRCRFNEKKFTFLAIEKSAFCAKRKVGSSVVSCFRPLTAITLKGVDIVQEVLDYFFLNCPLLERLSVIDSKDVVNLKVSGPLLKLKYLEISNCSEITSIEISAANLASFMYSGPKIDLLMKNVPRLVELSLGCQYPGLFIEQIWKHISYLSQLEKLSVELDDDVRVPLHFPEFKNLTQLEIFSMTSDYHTLLWITSFIGSCPSLRKFAIKLAFYEFSPRKSVAHMFKEKRKREAQRARKCRHECLKEVELKGYRGRRTYVELALSLLKTAVSLEKIIIDTRLQFRLHQNLPRDRVKSHDGTQEYRESAMKLKEKVPVGVRCVVL